jgi:hypothetical protein
MSKDSGAVNVIAPDKIPTGLEVMEVPSLPMLGDSSQPSKKYALGAYQQNGEIFIHVDSLDGDVYHDTQVKRDAYEYRHRLGRPNHGIEIYDGPFLIRSTDLPKPLVKNPDNKYVHRAIYRLTPGLP